jgi:hypothetical protein
MDKIPFFRLRFFAYGLLSPPDVSAAPAVALLII